MKYIQGILTTVIALLLGLNALAQLFYETKPTIYISPSITIGYTFRCGWNYGFDITLGYRQIQSGIPTTAMAINSQFYVINYRGETHKITAFNFVVDNTISQFGFGIGRIWKTWGYKNVNKDAALGYSLVFDFGMNNYKYPWIGIKAFVPTAKWTWSSLPYYFSFNTFWRQEPFVIH